MNIEAFLAERPVLRRTRLADLRRDFQAAGGRATRSVFIHGLGRSGYPIRDMDARGLYVLPRTPNPNSPSFAGYVGLVAHLAEREDVEFAQMVATLKAIPGVRLWRRRGLRVEVPE